MKIDGVKLDTAVSPTSEVSQPTPSRSQWLKSLIADTPKNLQEHFGEIRIYLRGLFTRCKHQWLLQRSPGANETMGNITLKYGSRLIKWCDKCGKTTHPTKQELEENPPIFRTIKRGINEHN